MHNSQARAGNMAVRDLSLQLTVFQRHRLLHVDEANKKEWHMVEQLGSLDLTTVSHPPKVANPTTLPLLTERDLPFNAVT